MEKIAASVVAIDQLEKQFNLQETEAPNFFPEWQESLPPLTETEKQILDKVKAGYFNLLKHPPFLENSIKMAIIAPLLLLADFFLPPFHFKTETSVSLKNEEEPTTIEGKIDVLVLKDQLWLTVIESKQIFYSLEAARSQILAYMLANPNPQKTCYGMITNGGSFLFLKLTKSNNPQYATSDPFDLLKKKTNDLYPVLQILKRFGQLTIDN